MCIRDSNLAQAKEDEKTQYTALKARIKAMYESGDDDYLQMLLGSGDLKTMLNNQEYISKINEYDHNLLVSLQNIRDQIAAYEAQLEEQKELQEAQKLSLIHIFLLPRRTIIKKSAWIL